MVGAAKMGMDIRLVAPKQFWPEGLLAHCRNRRAHWRGKITLTEDVQEGVRLWLPIHRRLGIDGWSERSVAERINLMMPYQVNMEMLKATGTHTLNSCTVCQLSMAKIPFGRQTACGWISTAKRRCGSDWWSGRVWILYRVRWSWKPHAHHQSCDGWATLGS